MRGPVRVLGSIILIIALFWVWYMIAADYGYGMISGTYKFKQEGETSILILKKDRTFVQVRNRHAEIERTQGTWHRSGEGGIDFSKEFLAVSNSHAESDGCTYGEVRKTFLELIPYIVLGQDWDHGPRFHRRLFYFAKEVQ